MLGYSKAITILVCAVVATSPLADQRAQSAMNQNGSEKVVAQLRYSWKNINPTPIVSPAKKPLHAAKRAKARSVLTQVKRAARS